MKSKTASTPEKKKTPLREPKSAGIVQAAPPPEVTASAPVSPKTISTPAPKRSSRKSIIPTVTTAAPKVLKPKAPTRPAKIAVPAAAVATPEPVAPVKVPAPVQPTPRPAVAAAVPLAPTPLSEPKKPVATPQPISPIVAPAEVKPVITMKQPEPAKVVVATVPVVPAPQAVAIAEATTQPAAPVSPVSEQPVKEHKTRVTSSTVVRRTYTQRKKYDVPAILKDSDESLDPVLAGPGQKFALGGSPTTRGTDPAEGELPEAYGTKKLFLTARDPHWLYAHWDLTLRQQHEYNAGSSDGHLVLRVYAARIEGHPLYEIHVHPESRHWFIHVERAGNSYCAELGYYSPVGKWMRISVSSATVTPPDAASPETDVEFATIPTEIPFPKLMHIIEEAVRENLPLVQAIEELRRAGHPDLPKLKPVPASAAPVLSQAYHSDPTGHASNPGSTPVVPPITWTPQQEQALARVISIDQSRRIWMGSLEITELIRRRLTHEVIPTVSSPMQAFGRPGPEMGWLAANQSGLSVRDTASSPAQPFGSGSPVAKSFWFNVNAELIVYGATEPGAKVTLGGHEIKLRPDGTFSYRFALPDGKYELPAIAISADGTDGRSAELKFARETNYLGNVGTHPQDPSLKPPVPDSLPTNL